MSTLKFSKIFLPNCVYTGTTYWVYLKQVQCASDLHFFGAILLTSGIQGFRPAIAKNNRVMDLALSIGVPLLSFGAIFLKSRDSKTMKMGLIFTVVVTAGQYLISQFISPFAEIGLNESKDTELKREANASDNQADDVDREISRNSRQTPHSPSKDKKKDKEGESLGESEFF